MKITTLYRNALLLILPLLLTGTVLAQMDIGPAGNSESNSFWEKDLPRFKNVIKIPAREGSFPEVYELSPFESSTSSAYVLIDTTERERNVGAQMVRMENATINDGAASSPEYPAITDRRDDTFVEFPFGGTREPVTITLISDMPVTSSAFQILLSNYVTAPDTVALSAYVGGEKRVVIAERNLSSVFFNFPETTSSRWEVTLRGSQPLRIKEVNLVNSLTKVIGVEKRSLRMLLNPKHSYELYVDIDASLYDSYFYDNNYSLSSLEEKKVKRLENYIKEKNVLFKELDSDGDLIPDKRDNCPSVSNYDQGDEDGNGKGNVCDDRDYDGVMNNLDNCLDKPNPDQRDTDADGMGDFCDKEESRLTEKYPWLPWVGIGGAGLVLVILVALTAKDLRKRDETSV